MKSRCLAVVLAVTLVAPSMAWAQPKKKPLRDQLTGEAQKQWDTALAFYQRGKWAEARASFNAAYEASHNPRVLFNVGVCDKNQGQYARAIDDFKKELADGKGQLDAGEEAEVNTQISGLQQFVATLTIDVNEPGADVYVDDQKVGVSPLPAPVQVPFGERRVRATKAGFGEAVDTRELKGGASATMTLKLVPFVKTSRVNVQVVGPPTADVRIDDRIVGQAPYSGQVTVSAEPHQISAEAPGWVTAKQPAIVKEGEALNLTIQMSQEQAMGELDIVAKPEGATIEIDGKSVGATSWKGAVEARVHQVSVKKQGFYSWSYDVDVPKGGERTVSANLNEDRNTSFVPWLIGTVVVVGLSATAAYFITKPKDEDRVNGTLPPFTVGTPALRWH